MDVSNPDFTIVSLIQDYGFPTVMVIGLGYYVYYVWNFVSEHIEPEVEKMHMQLIKLIDQVRMLDQDMIRLQQKVDVILEMRGNEKKRKNERETWSRIFS